MSRRAPWYCHDCEHTAPSLAAAREHSKSAPVYRGGKVMRHVLTQNAENATADRNREPDARQYGAAS